MIKVWNIDKLILGDFMYYYINVFFLFSILGHCLESFLFPSYDSGILAGYWTPVYGFGVVLILLINLVLKKYVKVNKWLYPLILFISCGIILSIIEMIGGYLIELIFNRVFWNYKYHKFNIGLYTSLEMALVWGISSLGVVYLIKPILDKFILKIPKFISWVLIFLFIVDILYKVSTIF